MKRKGLGIVLSLVMAMTVGVTAMAAPSKTVTGIVEDITTTDSEGTDVSISVVEVPDKFAGASKKLNDKATLKEILGDDYKSTYKVWDEVGLKANGNIEDAQFPVTVRTDIAGVKEGSDVIVVQWNGSEWVQLDATVYDGYVEFDVDDLGPIAFIADMKTVSATSPTTGDVAPMVAVAMMMAAAGAVVLGKKEFAR